MNEFENQMLPVLMVDNKGIIISCNSVFTELFGYSHHDIVDSSLETYLSLTECNYTLHQLISLVSSQVDGMILPAKLSNIYHYALPVKIHCQQINSDSLTGVVRICFRVLDNKSVDPISGLPNGWAISSRAKCLLAHPENIKNTFVLIFFNVDNFSTINFRYGFDAGDNYLLVLGRTLKKLLGDSTVVARFNNAKFGILIENKQGLYSDSFHTYTELLCENLCKLSDKPLKLDNGLEINKSYSIGVSQPSVEYNSFHAIEIAAETAMLQAKKYSTSRYHFSTSKTSGDILSHKLIIDALPSAIEQNIITVFYQPQYEISSGKLIGLEALSRWHHATLGNVTPDVFVGIAEEIGLHFDFDLWVLNQVCSQIVSWNKHNIYAPKVAINISFKTLEMTTFINRLIEVIEQTQCPTDLIELEITETASAKNMDVLNKNIIKVKQLGISIAIDDFGAGYSSLNMIREFHQSLDKLKLDRSLVKNICNTDVDREFIKKIIKLSKVLDVEILAEGVEEEEQKILLQKLECHYAQGYYFSKPLSKQNVENLLKTIS
ncbi:EAL domain-containing protein [Vibrio sp. TH_r3]|uniref:sensor domain-containing protein n=1 Tax=Vibrio sp. TH_r3 TaxID=3082084 RepID=UPI002952E467|nr:EAL domain-containing protein [Vibrio sp. TH_r3]MDV7103725.1 EAL domain-containing protein [Vibrio sp. TH_r3]